MLCRYDRHAKRVDRIGLHRVEYTGGKKYHGFIGRQIESEIPYILQ